IGLAGLAAAGAMTLTVFGVLRAPANTLQLREDPGRFVPKLTNDASRLRLWFVAPVAAFGAWALATGGDRPRPPRRAIVLAVLTGWVVLAVAGLAFGVVTKALPPHRFLELLVVVPGAVALGEAVAWVVAWVGAHARTRSRAVAGWVVGVAAILLLA